MGMTLASCWAFWINKVYGVVMTVWQLLWIHSARVVRHCHAIQYLLVALQCYWQLLPTSIYFWMLVVGRTDDMDTCVKCHSMQTVSVLFQLSYSFIRYLNFFDWIIYSFIHSLPDCFETNKHDDDSNRLYLSSFYCCGCRLYKCLCSNCSRPTISTRNSLARGSLLWILKDFIICNYYCNCNYCCNCDCNCDCIYYCNCN